MNSKLFSFYEHSKDQLDKFIPISSQITEGDLGLSEYDRQKLLNEVHIVVHVAASVKFDATLR